MAVIRSDSIEGILSVLAKSNTIDFKQSNGTNRISLTSSGATINGTLIATEFSGSGASLTSIPAAQLSGNVSDGNIPSFTSSKLTGALPGGVKLSDAQYNTSFGTNAGDSFTGTDAVGNTLFGYDAGTALTSGDETTVFGAYSLKNATTQGESSAFGYSALRDCTSGADNTAMGHNALLKTQGGSNNTATGNASLQENISGSNNTALGELSGQNATGSSNVFIGQEAAVNNTSGDNNIIIGKSATSSTTTISNEITLGDSNITKFRVPGINVILKDNGGSPTAGHVLTVDSSGEASFSVGGVTNNIAIAYAVAIG
tara:strand:+ start:5885 stop:6829 length:945 start_codon:yes stop_codon:yes gene_type:complete